MTVNSYLTVLAADAIIRDAEKQSIQRSIAVIQSRLNAHFAGDLSQHFIFGSYTRGTILPRSMDSQSDIDYMVVFKDVNYRPQTYIDRLRRFVTRYYATSDIAQSSPTVVLSLNHIRFELVPAVNVFLYGLQIPAKASSYNDWISTDPNSFNQTLVNANGANSNLIKPLVRLVKYWNARNGYVYESYELEKMIAGRSYWHVGGLLSGGTLQDYFYDFMESLECGWTTPQWKADRINRARQLVREARLLQRQGQETLAERKVQQLLPPVNGLLGLRLGA